MSDIEQWIFREGFRALRPDPLLTVSEWADHNRVLSSVASAEPGPWRTSRVPYMREIMDALSTGSPYETVVFMKGSQISATECGNNWIGYVMDKAPGPMMMIMPTDQMAKENSRIRIDPLINESPALKTKVAEQRSRDAANNMVMKEFPGGYLAMTGANSPSSLSSKPIKYLFLDEVDRYPGSAGDEGDPVNLARTRTRTFSRRKIFMASTPTTQGKSRIELAFEETDKRYYFVPCPHCGHYQVLMFRNLKWEHRRPETAHYECEKCQAAIYNHDKTEMLERGEWRATVKDYRGRAVGFHLSALYSPVGWLSWTEIADMWIKAQGNRELMQVFFNTVLGETWQERGDAPPWERLYYRRGGYKMRQIPAGGLFLTAGVDVQKDRIEVVVRAWGRDKVNYAVAWDVYPGDTADINSECYRSLDRLMNEAFEHESGAIMQIQCLAIDTGYNTSTVYAWCRKYPINRVMPIKGMDSLSVMLGHPKAVDVVVDGKKKSKALKLWGVNGSMIKTELYGWLRLEKPEPGTEDPPGMCYFAEEFEEDFFKQLTSEHMLTKEMKGRRVFIWEKLTPNSRNEVLDCYVYSRAAAAVLQIDRFTAQTWDQLEKMLVGSVRERDPDIEPVPQTPPPSAPAQPPKTAAARRYGVMSRGVKL